MSDAALMNIGYFFVLFSEIESEINDMLLRLLELEEHPAATVIFPDYEITKKIDLVKLVSKNARDKRGEPIPGDWPARCEKLMNAVQKINDDDRRVFAHVRLLPGGDGTVTRRRLSHRGGKAKHQDELFTQERFKTLFERMDATLSELRALHEELNKIYVKFDFSFTVGNTFYGAEVKLAEDK